MNQIKKIAFILFLCATHLSIAQKIDITLTSEANKKYSLVLHKGIKQDTIQSSSLNFMGNTVIQIPKEEKGYKGMATLDIQNGQKINLIINNENFSLSTQGNRIVFKNSPENTYLYAYLQNEAKPAVNNALYAQSFLELIGYMSQLNNAVNKGADMATRSQIKLYAKSKLDMEKLYTSSVWQHVVDGILKLSADEQDFAATTQKMVDRIKSEEILIHFAENLILITQQFGMEEAYEEIVSYIKKTGRIKTPYGKVFEAFDSLKVRTGDIAPAIVGLNKNYREPYNKTLVAFYDPDCVSCELQIDLLKKRYAELKNKKIRVVSISSEHDKNKFPQNSKNFPWTDKLADFKGYAGDNYKNFGILGTPTFILLDKDNKLLKRNAELKNMPLE